MSKAIYITLFAAMIAAAVAVPITKDLGALPTGSEDIELAASAASPNWRDESDYVRGVTGVNGCPQGSFPIRDQYQCKMASAALGLTYQKEEYDGHSDALCNYCGGCSPKTVRVDHTHGKKADWLCATTVYRNSPKAKATIVCTGAMIEQKGCKDGQGRESGWLTTNKPYTVEECAKGCNAYKYFTIASGDKNCKCADVCVNEKQQHSSYQTTCGPAYRLAAVGEQCGERAPEELCKTIAADHGKTFHYNQDKNDAKRPMGCFRDTFYPAHVFYNKHLTGGNYAGPYQQYCGPLPAAAMPPPSPPKRRVAPNWRSEDDYVRGVTGVNGCPEGSFRITDQYQCKMASAALNLTYQEEVNDGHSDALCNWCGGCSPKTVRVDHTHGKKADWICGEGRYSKAPKAATIEGGPAYRLAAVGEACERTPEALCKTIAADLGKTFHYNQEHNDAKRPIGCFYSANYPAHVFYNKHLTGGRYMAPFQQFCAPPPAAV